MTYEFRNIKTGKTITINSTSPAEIAQILQRDDDHAVHEGSISHLLKGYRTFAGSWRILNGPDKVKPLYNKTDRKQSPSTTQPFSQLTPAQKVDKMRLALEKAIISGDHRMATTLRDMIRSFDAKSISSRKGSDLNTHLTKTISLDPALRKMSIKQGREKHDIRIRL